MSTIDTTWSNAAPPTPLPTDILRAYEEVATAGPILIGFHFHSQADLDLVAAACVRAEPGQVTLHTLHGVACYVTPHVAHTPGLVAALYSDNTCKFITIYQEGGR